MENDSNLQIIYEQLETILLFLEREVVQRQLVVVVVIALLAWWLSEGLWHRVWTRMTTKVESRFGETWQFFWQQTLLGIKYITYPLFGIILTYLTSQIFLAWDWRSGLVKESITFFWLVFLGYRIMITLTYQFIGEEVIKFYHYRLFLPLFILMSSGQILAQLIDVNLLAQAELLNLFNDPLTLGELTFTCFILYLLYALSWATRDVIEVLIVPRTQADPNTMKSLLRMGSYIIISIGILIIFSMLGVDLTTITFISTGLSVGIGFGLQQIFANLVSGVLLMFERSVRPGDVVKVDGQLGVVDRMSIRATTVMTYDNVEMIVPNETLLTSTVINYTGSTRVIRLVMLIGVSYQSDPQEVIEILQTVAQEHQFVRQEPEPTIFFQEFAESSLRFRLHVWVDDPNYLLRVPSDLRLAIWYEFKKRGIEIPFPQRDLHLRSGFSDLEFVVGPPPETSKTVTTNKEQS